MILSGRMHRLGDDSHDMFGSTLLGVEAVICAAVYACLRSSTGVLANELTGVFFFLAFVL